MQRYHSLSLLVLLVMLPLGCTSIKPPVDAGRTTIAPHAFSHEILDNVLQRVVNDRGEADYADLKDDQRDLDRYYRLLAAYSPDSHPFLFPTGQSKLAYWINAYNTAAIKIVMAYYPISSVEDVEPPGIFFFLPKKSGFFLFQRITLGGKAMSLYALENHIIRKRFSDPRIHFALNCASRSCPHLPRRAFSAKNLDDELERETRLFLADSRNVKIDDRNRIVYLSSILDWYEKDFVTWYHIQFPLQKASLLNYVALYLPRSPAEKMKRMTDDQIRFTPYDWSLNDQSTSI